ncbi:MAG: Aspartate aminotransferase, partial [uncultured Phycisphaerae bacterium]
AATHLPADAERAGADDPGRRRDDQTPPGHDLARAGRGPLRPAAAGRRGRRPGRDGRPANLQVRAGVRARRVARRDPGEAGGREQRHGRPRPAGGRHVRVEHGVPQRRDGRRRPGRRGDPAVAVLLQPRDGDRHRRVPGGRRPDRRRLPAAGRRDRGRRHAADAGG